MTRRSGADASKFDSDTSMRRSVPALSSGLGPDRIASSPAPTSIFFLSFPYRCAAARHEQNESKEKEKSPPTYSGPYPVYTIFIIEPCNLLLLRLFFSYFLPLVFDFRFQLFFLLLLLLLLNFFYYFIYKGAINKTLFSTRFLLSIKHPSSFCL